MRKLISPHLGGSWANNLETLRKWQPPIILLLQPEVDKATQLKEACPDAIIIGRFYHDDNHYASNINARPQEFAHEIHNEIVNHPVTPLLDYVQSNNETNQDWAGIQKLNTYTLEWMHLADQSQAYKCAILAFSVGNPDLPYKPNDPAGFDGRMLYWQQVLPSLNYAQTNNHVLLMHAYGYPDMFHPNEDWYIYRYEIQVQGNLRTLGITNLKYAYGEIGIDRLIVNGKGGYKVVPTTSQGYVNQLLQWERDLQSQSLLLGGAIFTYGDSGGWDTYNIADTNVASLIAEHYVQHASDYEPAATGGQIFIPTVSTGTQPQAPTLPPSDIDPRLVARGVTLAPSNAAPGQQFWRVVKARWYNEQEADALGPDHHILADVLDAQGTRIVGQRLFVKWPTDSTVIHTEAKPGEPYSANFPMSPSRNEFSIGVLSYTPSEIVQGIGMGAMTPGGYNAGIHTSTGVVFQLATMPATQSVPSTTPQPMYVIASLGANLRDTPGMTTLEQSNILKVVPYGERVDRLAVAANPQWLHVRHEGTEGYMFHSLLSETPPAPTPSTPPPPSDCWQRAIDFVLRWEGEWADHPSDPGGATMRGITLNTYTRWRAAHGQPAPTKDDLRNISAAEVHQIYREWYWDESGAATLPWPLCLIHFDTAVNAGTGRAQEMLAKSNGDFLAYAGHLIDWYTRIGNFEHFGKAWMRRRADLLLEASR